MTLIWISIDNLKYIKKAVAKFVCDRILFYNGRACFQNEV